MQRLHYKDCSKHCLRSMQGYHICVCTTEFTCQCKHVCNFHYNSSNYNSSVHSAIRRLCEANAIENIWEGYDHQLRSSYSFIHTAPTTSHQNIQLLACGKARAEVNTACYMRRMSINPKETARRHSRANPSCACSFHYDQMRALLVE